MTKILHFRQLVKIATLDQIIKGGHLGFLFHIKSNILHFVLFHMEHYCAKFGVDPCNGS